ncbi:MAG TPA: glycoside hydrolase family 2 TIM barrel-domain containing protein, partial [Bacteroidales bacterium]|nr:glycoside hydrolase family 2 TIM barrel-domain containing protein [Bacteroidales bacterium]
YHRKFSVPDNWKDLRVLLHFGAVDWETTVWVNDRVVGTHRGGFTAFSFDITKYLKKGEQELVVSVWDPTDSGDQPRGKQALEPKGIWYTPVTGIWQTVWLEPVGATSIKSLFPVSHIEKSTVTIHTDIDGAKGDEEINFKVLRENKIILEKKFQAKADAILEIPSKELWTPDSPVLYQLELELTRNKKLLDRASSYFAIREIAKVKDKQGIQRISLNDETIFQYGTLDQGWWPDGLLTPPSANAMLYDMQILKSMGFNMLRKHIKAEPSLYYYYADSLGLMLWQDMVSGFETSGRSSQHVNWDAPSDWKRPPESSKQFEYELKSMIDQLRFFQSIVTWVVFNEGWGQYDTKRIADWCMNYDTTRIINATSGWTDRNCGDMIDAHQYPGPGMEPPVLNPGRISVLGEFGGLGLPVEGHLWDNKLRNWGYRTYTSTPELIKEYTKLMHNLYPLKSKGLSAAIYTQTTDVETEVNGLMTYDRKVIKMDPDLLRILHAPLYGTNCDDIKELVSDSEIKAQKILVSKTNPGEGWYLGQSQSVFSEEHAPAVIKKGESAWSSSSFNLDEIPDGLSLKILAYGIVKVYLNGNIVLDKRIIGKRHYEEINISEFTPYLRKANNIVAIEAVDFEADSQFDYGLYTY